MYIVQNSNPLQEKSQFINFDNIYQIYYSDKTRKQCFHGFNAYNNKRLSPFIENTPILDIYHTEFKNIGENDWFGVLSPKFFQKAQGPRPINAIELDRILSATDKDVLGFNVKATQRNIITQADHYHKDYTKVFQMIIDKAGIEYDIRLPSRKLFVLPSGHQVYSNVFSNAVIAKKWVFDMYIKEVLKPCYEVMSDPNNTAIMDIIWKDSGYQRLTKRDTSSFKSQIGVAYYPYHTFVCERFWTMFLNMNKQITMTHYPYE